MTGRRFIDTNIVVYAYDSSAADKQRVAQQVLIDAATTGDAILSVQVLGEFFHATVTRRKLLTVEKAEQAIAALCQLEVVRVDAAMVHQAITIHRRYGLRYWDALIVATAVLSGCERVIS